MNVPHPMAVNPTRPTSPFAGMSPHSFLAKHWQKKPLLIRGGLPSFQGIDEPDMLMDLACRDDCQSRLILRRGSDWQVEHGPFEMKRLRRLSRHGWTLLVQGVEQFLPSGRALLDQFNFIPHARLDDLMVSYAPAGDGVGPHFDNYDVFLVQGCGRRRWQVSHQDDLALIPNLPLKILERFEPQGECVLETGDLLYLPPRWAHDGVAMEPCFTYSVGFRAPDHAQLANAFLEWMADGIHMEGRYADPDLHVTTRPGELPAKMIADSCSLMESLRWNSQSVRDFLGIYLSEPKSHVVFNPPTRPLSMTTFASKLKGSSVHLSAHSCMLYQGRNIYINGEHEATNRRLASVLTTLADHRTLDGSKVTPVQPLLELLYQWYRAGFIELRQNRRTAKI